MVGLCNTHGEIRNSNILVWKTTQKTTLRDLEVEVRFLELQHLKGRRCKSVGGQDSPGCG